MQPLCSQASVTELLAESLQAVKGSPLEQAHGQDTKTEYGPVYVLLVCVVSENHFKEPPTQLILKQKIRTSEVDGQAITQKFVSNKLDLVLGCGGERLGKETWQSVREVVFKLSQEVTHLF